MPKTRPSSKTRCRWVTQDPLYQKYHDEEWGRPVHDDRVLFEYLILEGAQAGLSWFTVLKKRENYRKVFFNFDPSKVARISPAQVKKILKDEGIIRNRLKVESTVSNAKAFMEVQKEFGSFDKYIWQFVGHRTKVNRITSSQRLPATTAESDNMSKDLHKRVTDG
jgi:DNA-3-methyladenine glycosylase I